MSDKPLRLHYCIDTNSINSAENKKNFAEISAPLSRVGVYLNVYEYDDGANNYLTLAVNKDTYDRVTKREAGRRRKFIPNPETGADLRYSDVIYMLQTMSGKKVAEELQMSLSTFNRHKKKMLNSVYYKNLDRNRLNDLDYLNSVTTGLNRYF